MSRSEVVIVAPLARIGQRTRLVKFAAVYAALGFGTSHLGWDRTEDDRALPILSGGTRSVSLHFGGGKAESGLGKHYVLWSGKLLWQLIKQRPSIVHALGLESALPAVVAKLLGCVDQVIFDDADRMSLTHKFPAPIRYLVQLVERWVSRNATAHIYPGQERYPDGIPCAVPCLLKNTPSRDALMRMDEAKARDDEALRVLVTGWIGETRGSGLLLRLARHFAHDPSVAFVAAGRATGDDAAQFVSLESVEYHGEVDNSRALEICRDSDLVFTLYDPVLPINRFAEPNKWGDCAALGVPFAVNSEVMTARTFVRSGMAVALPYADVEGWIDLLSRFSQDYSELATLRAAASEQSASLLTFEEQAGSVLREVLGVS